MSSLDQIRQIVATLVGIPLDQVMAKSNLIDDLGMDSLDAIEALIAVEQEFRVDLRDQTFKGSDETPEEIARRVDALINPPFAELADLAKAGLKALKRLPDDILAEETADLDVDWDASIDAIIAEKDGETTP